MHYVLWILIALHYLKAKNRLKKNNHKHRWSIQFGNLNRCHAVLPIVEIIFPYLMKNKPIVEFVKAHSFNVTEEMDDQLVFVWSIVAMTAFLSVGIDGLMVLLYGKWQVINLGVPIIIGFLGGIGITKFNITAVKRERRRDIAFHLPDFMTRFSLYLYAGYGVSNAWGRALQQESTSPMLQIMKALSRNTMNSKSERMIYYEIGQKLQDQRIDRLLGLIQNASAFGDQELFIRLDQFKQELAYEKLREVRVMGEEAKVKLVIPLFINLAGILTLIMVPIFITLRGILK